MTAPVTFQLFAKAPVAGTVKTRLVPALSPADAAALHVRLVDHSAAAIAAVRRSLPHARAELWCAPDCSDPVLRAIATRHGLSVRLQEGSDLGARMRNALHSAMPGVAILAGSDCPLLDAASLLSAVNAVSSADAVFMPADDGGYALVGCRARVPRCFDGVRWSTPAVMHDTRALLARAGTRWVELPTVWDVDWPTDLARLASDPRTAPLLAGLAFDASGEAQGQHPQRL